MVTSSSQDIPFQSDLPKDVLAIPTRYGPALPLKGDISFCGLHGENVVASDVFTSLVDLDEACLIFLVQGLTFLGDPSLLVSLYILISASN